MKRTGLLVAAAGVGALVAGTGFADIEGSAHDFSDFAWSENKICLPCHTPHGGNTDVPAPLWNHELTTASYTLFGGEQGGVEDLDIRSVLCMSCHDGTVALDSFGGKNGSQFITGALIGTDLQDDHPVGGTAVYPDVPWMVPPSEWEDDHGMRLHAWVDPDTNEEQDVVSCYTCHEPHNRRGTEYMTWKSNDGSQLCLTCHIK